LETIIESMTEIKADMRSMKAEMKEDMQDVKSEVQDLRERLAKVEASAASAHKRLDTAIGAQKDR
jgi:predicted nuclease with TOPRIM domain